MIDRFLKQFPHCPNCQSYWNRSEPIKTSCSQCNVYCTDCTGSDTVNLVRVLKLIHKQSLLFFVWKYSIQPYDQFKISKCFFRQAYEKDFTVDLSITPISYHPPLNCSDERLINIFNKSIILI